MRLAPTVATVGTQRRCHGADQQEADELGVDPGGQHAASRPSAPPRMPFIFPHVALMPDAHLGKGATVGSVIPTLARSFRLRSVSISAAA